MASSLASPTCPHNRVYAVKRWEGTTSGEWRASVDDPPILKCSNCGAFQLRIGGPWIGGGQSGHPISDSDPRQLELFGDRSRTKIT